MRDTENIKQVAALFPDYLGFIFYEQSPRYVGDSFIIPDIAAEIKKVGVFANEKLETIQLLVKRHQLDFAQLHGQELPADCERLKQSGVKLIKAFSVDSNFDFNSTMPYESMVDYFLFDTKGKKYGGNAVAFDWSLLSQYHQRIPFFLSGGLNPENIKTITTLSTMNLHALDINSGVEILPGVKSTDMIIEFKNILKLMKYLKPNNRKA